MNDYIQLARKAVGTFLEKNKIISVPDNLPKIMYNTKAGVFVTIKNKKEELRGCIGTPWSVKKNIAEEIIHNAISAASTDYRFSSIDKKELKELCFSVSVLTKPEPISDVSQLDPKKYGIIVKTNSKSALLLPDLENIKFAEEQLFAACQKAGINPQTEAISIYRFQTKEYKEKC